MRTRATSDAMKVIKALDKLHDAPTPIATSNSALLPLTPFEKGYVIGVLAEYRRYRREHGR